MPAERAGYTVTMFLVDLSPSMAKSKAITQIDGNVKEMTALQWGLQFVKLKVQEMIFNGRKTDQCGIITFGSEGTKNVINSRTGGYEHVTEYIPIAQPNARTLARLDRLEPSKTYGDSIDALIVAIEAQNNYLGKKKTWTRKIVLVTDGESPLEIDNWEEIVTKMNELNVSLAIVGIDFDDPEVPFKEEDKSNIKEKNEEFFAKLTKRLNSGVVGNHAYALQEIAFPDIKVVKSALMGTVLRLGDVAGQPKEAVEILVKTSKCTALARPKGWKKFAQRIKKKKKKKEGEEGADDDDDDDDDDDEEDEDAMEVDPTETHATFSTLKMQTEYYMEKARMEGREPEEEIIDDESTEDDGKKKKKKKKKEDDHIFETAELVRGFKYGTTYVPCPDGQFPRLETKKGIEICGFFSRENFRRELSMGEIQYVWADPASSQQQIGLSSIVQAMKAEDLYAIARWATKDGMDVKMGVLAPVEFEKVDCLLWSQVPFADDVRKYSFPPLEKLVSKKGEVFNEHAYLPTKSQLKAMENFVDSMDLMDAGDKDEEGNRLPWFDTRLSYNPAIHRIKQAMFHCAVTSDVAANPPPPPHPSLTTYWDPPRRAVKRAHDAIEECMEQFKVREVPAKVPRARKLEHVHANEEEEDEPLLLEEPKPSGSKSQVISIVDDTNEKKDAKQAADDSATEDESDEELLLDKEKAKKTPSPPPRSKGNGAHLPTPGRSPSPDVEPDAGRAPGRIIGSTFPLKDFEENLQEGDIVSKAVEDMAFVIRDIVKRPFASRRKDELMKCMRVLRDTALKEDEIEAWNKFLTDLKEDCAGKPGNKQFWAEIMAVGRELSLISHKEASALGGESKVTEKAAQEFLS